MKQLLLYSLFLIIAINSFGQSTFQTSYGDSEIDNGNAITATTSNGYCVVGTNRNSTGTENADIIIYNIDDNGGLLWSAKIGTDRSEYPADIIQTPDGGFAITGYTYGGLIDSLTTDVFLLKTDDQGFPTFFQTFGGTSDDGGTKVLNSADGGFYITGLTNSFGNGIQNALAIRTDANGNQVWSNVNSVFEYTSYRSACFNRQGQILAAGTTFDLMNNNYDDYISLIDTTGNLLWSKRLGSSIAENLFQIISLNDGNILTAGTSRNLTAGGVDINICKLDSSGTIIWNKNYGSSLYDDARSIAVCSNGDIVITGTTNILNSTTPLYQTTIARLNSTGDLLWSNTYGDPSGNSGGASVINGLNNTLISIGYISSPSDINGETYFVKTDENGTSGCYQQPLILQTNTNTFTDSSGADSQSIFMTDFIINPNWVSFSNQFSLYCFNSSVDQISNYPTAIVYPNPGTGLFKIETGNSDLQHLKIYDALGQKIIEKDFTSEVVDVDMTNYPIGIYYFTIDDLKKGKIVLANN